MIAIDDSRSMQPSEGQPVGAGQLALEAMAVICNAMARLEVGQVSVVSFGEEVQLLHPFAQQFSASAGTSIVSRFTFGQSATNVVQTVQWIVNRMKLAREAEAEQLDQMQLVFLITDGLGFFKDTLSSLRKMTQQEQRRCLFVLLAIDPPGSQSLTEMKRPQFDEKKNFIGLSHVIDEFPFSYYILVRDIHSLPEILGESLRQWWEMMRRQAR